jgi:hypothetical protein
MDQLKAWPHACVCADFALRSADTRCPSAAALVTRKLQRVLRDDAALLSQAFDISQTHCCAALEMQCARLLAAQLHTASTDDDPDIALSAAAVSLQELHAAHPGALQRSLAVALRDAIHVIFGRPPAAAAV